MSDRPPSYDRLGGAPRGRSTRRRAMVLAGAALVVFVGGAVVAAVVSGRGQVDRSASPPSSAPPPVVTTSAPGLATTTTTTTTSVPPTTAPTTSTPAAPVTLLVVDTDGVWLWGFPGERRLVLEGAVASALPDRVGGIVFQAVETGAWRPLDAGQLGVAEWRWVGRGAPEPIQRVRQPSGIPETVVTAPADGDLQLVDVAMVDGHPALAYLRTRYFRVTSSEDNPWWGSACAELVVRDLETGAERVVRSQDVGWEWDLRRPSVGSDVVAEAVLGYGDLGSWVELLDFDGSRPAVGYRLPSCECELAADLPPVGTSLVYVERRLSPTGEGTDLAVVTLDRSTGLEQQRVSLPGTSTAQPLALDTVAGQTLVVTSVWEAVPGVERPVLRPGDRGAWVVQLQKELSDGDTHVIHDGVFGPQTEAAVRSAQTAAGLDPTGIVDAATWDVLPGGPHGALWIAWKQDPILVGPDGSSRVLPVLPAGSRTPGFGDTRGPEVTLWTDGATAGS